MLLNRVAEGRFSAIAASFNPALKRDVPQAARPLAQLQGLPQIYNRRFGF